MTTDGGWHASPALLAAYANGLSGPSDSWSVEAHLVGCPGCRAALALALPAEDLVLLADQQTELLASLPRRRDAVPPAGGARWVVRPGVLLAVVVAVLAATLLDLCVTAGAGPSSVPALWLLAPVVPPLGVALSTIGEDDPARDAVLATPRAGVRLTLWRTCVVVGTALPLTALAGSLLAASGAGHGGEFRWLLPSLAAAAVTLALGTVVALERAAAVVAAVWVVLVLTPALYGGNLSRVLLTSSPGVLTDTAQWCWLAVAALAVGVVVLRRNAFDRLSRWRNR